MYSGDHMIFANCLWFGCEAWSYFYYYNTQTKNVTKLFSVDDASKIRFNQVLNGKTAVYAGPSNIRAMNMDGSNPQDTTPGYL